MCRTYTTTLLLSLLILTWVPRTFAQLLPSEIESMGTWQLVEARWGPLGWARFVPEGEEASSDTLSVFYDNEGQPDAWKAQIDTLTYMRVPAYGLISIRGSLEQVAAYWKSECSGQGGLVLYAASDGRSALADLTSCSRPDGIDGEYMQDEDTNGRPDVVDAIDLLNLIESKAYERFPR